VNPDRVSVREAFDRHAGAYDSRFSQSFLALEIRAEVWRIAGEVYSPGMSILDLGCGTGEDAIHFARQGMRVTAIDLSPAMVSQLRLKAGAAVDCAVAAMEDYEPADGPLDGIFSNFGALNCSAELGWLRRLARTHLKPGGHLVLTTLGRFYPLESAVFLLKGRPALAFRRFGRRRCAAVEGVSFPVHYHSTRAIRRALGVDFELCRLTGLRSLTPSAGLEHLLRFRSLRLLEGIDRWMTRRRLLASWADHVVSVWRYCEK
jgi:SAM-dependent methyltransferase